ncbi:MAG TPA: hypothetical protein ENK91_13390 [Bacteroidetes bacterium]|nr:hypothetical protein [Bacteroidota bacterium]
MRKLSILTAVFFMVFIYNAYGQQGMLTSEENLIGESQDFMIGIHTGAFDCNQSVKYPYAIGVVGQYNYVPDITEKFFFGGEAGLFYTGSGEDKLTRKTRLVLGDITVYPGLSFPFGANITADDNATMRLKKLAQARRIRVGLGFTASFPIVKKSEGPGVNLDQVKPGVGFSLRSSIDLPNRLTLFLNATRIGRDLDGYAYKGQTAERSDGNKSNVSYYYKLGVMWNFLRK